MSPREVLWHGVGLPSEECRPSCSALSTDGLIACVCVQLDEIPERDLSPGVEVNLPHPGNYLFHKALTAPRRAKKAKMRKDLADL